MTRGNIVIKSPAQGLFFYYQIISDAYPKRIAPLLSRYNGSPESFEPLDLMAGQVGNFDYLYELDVGLGQLKIWESKIFWVNAPEDWRNKGYNCWIGKNGRYGYSSWRKGKRIYEYEYNTKIRISPTRAILCPNAYKSCHQRSVNIIPSFMYTKEQLKTLPEESWYEFNVPYYMAQLKYNPNLIHTWLKSDRILYKCLYEIPKEDLPLWIDDPDFKGIINWRLLNL